MILIERQPKYQPYHQAKIHKYEYLTGEEILQSNQQQIIEQAKFTCSPLRKAFEKQVKTVEDQGEKHVKALENFKNKEKRLLNINDYEDKSLLSKVPEIFKNIYNKRFDKIKELTEKIDDNNLEFTTLSTGIKTDFSKKDDPLTFLLKNFKKGKITIEEAKESQKDFNNYLKRIQGL